MLDSKAGVKDCIAGACECYINGSSASNARRGRRRERRCTPQIFAVTIRLRVFSFASVAMLQDAHEALYEIACGAESAQRTVRASLSMLLDAYSGLDLT